MNRPHLMAAVCFGVALLFYFFGLSKDYSTGFIVLGMFFEVVAWKNVLAARRQKAAAPKL